MWMLMVSNATHANRVNKYAITSNWDYLCQSATHLGMSFDLILVSALPLKIIFKQRIETGFAFFLFFSVVDSFERNGAPFLRKFEQNKPFTAKLHIIYKQGKRFNTMPNGIQLLFILLDLNWFGWLFADVVVIAIAITLVLLFVFVAVISLFFVSVVCVFFFCSHLFIHRYVIFHFALI